MHALLKAIFYTPLYNALIFFIAIIPFHNVGVAVILFTLLIKIILFPLSQKSVKTQFAMKQMEPELNAIKETYKDNKTLQAEKIMALYQRKVSIRFLEFSSCSFSSPFFSDSITYFSEADCRILIIRLFIHSPKFRLSSTQHSLVSM